MDVGLRDRVAADRCCAIVPRLWFRSRGWLWRDACGVGKAEMARRSWRTPSLSMRQMSRCLAAAEWMARFIAPPGPSCWPNAAGAAASVRNSIS